MKDLKSKRNSNDFMLVSMLEIEFETKPSERFKLAYEVACDYLDMENNLNGMCDFVDGKCSKYRKIQSDKNSCCAKRCEFFNGKPCEEKSLACKIFMCNDAENRGYYFDVNSIPVLKKGFSLPERFLSTGLLFNGEKRSIKQLKLLKATVFSLIVMVSLALIIILIQLFILLV